MLGDIYVAMGPQQEARGYYQKALELPKTVEPEFQSGRVAGLEQRLRQIKTAN
jgi:predicted negative regulator of RcsB-dependent stress response